MIHAIIPAGGAGTRLWPLSRRTTPKFLADLTGAGKSMLQQTVARLSFADSVSIVTGVAHQAAVGKQLADYPGVSIIAEPSPRDSMAAIGLAAAVIEQRHGEVVVGSFAADHAIADESAFQAAVQRAVTAAEQGYIVTIGITPDHPATGYGYIQAEAELLPGVRAVAEFKEKPDAELAAAYLATGKYFWNAGMFVARTSVLLAALAQYQPELHAGIMRIAESWDTPQQAEVLAENWPQLKKIAIDHAIAEPIAPTGKLAIVPVEMGWSDVGDYAALRDITASPVQVAPGGTAQSVLPVASPGALVYTYSKPITVLGVPDAVVVETADAILVTTREQAQNLKEVVEQLDAAGLAQLR
ncbi:MAG: mannose-1-phosphate guanylyltransferase [Trueperella sp.]|nr:mannose-1-phosphate guanylyltransferase [Trueperella sp.]